MIIKPKQALNKAYLKVKPTRDHLNLFKSNLIKLIDETNLDKREELHKNDFSDFLKNTYYSSSNYINIKDTIDLVIHSTTDPSSPIAVMIEAKSPTNKTEMITTSNINAKAMQELILYYLRERISCGNINLKHLIITNRYEWFIFDAALFEKLFGHDNKLISQFKDFEDKTLSVTKTKDFYFEIAKPAIEAVKEQINYTYFDIREQKKNLENSTVENDSKLIPLYKIFSPEHLLKLPIANDNNSLDKAFYSELLHIIGLEETKQGSKKIITRKDSSRRDNGSLLENCITELDNSDKLSYITNIENYGTTKEECLFNVALELVIIWINRILFLKLLEGQLISFNKNSKDYAFLNTNTIKGYDDLNNLFFGVLAKQQNERSENNKKLFAKIPYLNSSLFDPQSESLERSCFAISSLNYNRTLPIDARTVLKDRAGKKLTGEKNTLEYLFEFLNSYNFASDSNDEIQEDSKTIINAAVLGLIFEKINGYKDGSFYTPSFITMYMCRETIRRVIMEKFNKAKSWNCISFDELYNKIEDRNEANNLINSITICDPAVGSGHFLVSALNEIIAIKSELRILQDNDGKRLKEYQIEIVNDELIVIDEEGDLFAYNPNSKESQRVQTALFHEKQTIIENCLFGVDINPNSVKICRLRLWIELLKNTYYRNKENHELETLPNIDINIKCGNSLISRNELHESIEPILGNLNLKHEGNNKLITVDYYRKTVLAYKQAKTKEEKGRLEKLINKVKQEFSIGLYQASLFDEYSNKKLEMDAFYNKQHAFEWRFEFPEVLADNGEYKGFDIVIGNPPYISANELMAKYQDFRSYMSISTKYKTLHQKWDIYIAFIELSLHITNNGVCSYIIPYPYINQTYAQLSRHQVLEDNKLIELVDLYKNNVFKDATVKNCIITYQRKYEEDYQIAISVLSNELQIEPSHKIAKNKLLSASGIFSLQVDLCDVITNKNLVPLGDICFISKGMVLNSDEIKAKGYFKKKDLISLNENTINNKRYLEAKNFNKYCIKDIRFLEWGTDRCPSLISRPTFQELYKYPKLLINKLGNIQGTYDDTSVYCDQTVRLCMLWHYLENIENNSINNSIQRYARITKSEMVKLSMSFNIKYILAILNSKIGTYLLNQHRGVGNIDINPEYLKNIPIPKINIELQQPFVDIVEKILLVKEQQQSTTELEQQIDKMVYKLYDLTDEEMKIIEGSST